MHKAVYGIALAALLTVAGGRASAQPPSSFAPPPETEASDNAWEQEYMACGQRVEADAAGRNRAIECTRRLEMSRPLCDDYKTWVRVWFDLADNNPFIGSSIKSLFAIESDAIEELGTKDATWSPIYYKMPEVRLQLRRILAAAIARPTKWKDQAEFSQSVYRHCMHDLTERP
jgi:hypothetical protein